ncbi:MAG: DUF4125 family protein [Lachnospiraceae bacterium]
MDISAVLAKVDELIENGKAKEAEKLLIDTLLISEKSENDEAQLQILNELIGYYRQTSQKDELIRTIEAAFRVANKMGLDKTVAYATTSLNAATGYRSIGEFGKALECYRVTGEIYEKELPENDMRIAGFLNNKSLLYQEMGNFENAKKCLMQALDIVKANESWFETAVTYANLANTCVMLGEYKDAKEYSGLSMDMFTEHKLFDAHYCSALSAAGMCLFEEKNYSEALEYFGKAMKIIEENFGRNQQYERLYANYEECRKILGRMNGMELSKRYYEEYGKSMIENEFGDYAGKIAVGLVGEGSDCLGFDDETSMDHDWGPGFCMWVTDETYEQIGEKLEESYSKLPSEFMGYKTTKSSKAGKRRGVMTISGFYEDLLGASSYEDIDWSSVPDYALATATDGEVFRDDEGIFTEFRNKLKEGYPESVLYLKLAEDVAKISQTGQYNYERMYNRGDYLTANRMLSDCIYNTLKLKHHLINVYPPHDKWLYTSMLRLYCNDETCDIISRLNDSMVVGGSSMKNQISSIVDELAQSLAMELYTNHFISDIDPYLDNHTEELITKARYARLNNDELVDEIVRYEFEAFDKVKNEGGRASCQNDWPTFYVMRRSQYLTWTRTMLLQYIYDFDREYRNGHNLITEKYGRMMESTDPARYEEIKDNFPVISDEKKAVIEQIVAVYMSMMEKFAKEHPKVAGNARNLHTYEDEVFDTSYETYLRGEISTYSDKMLQLYGKYLAFAASQNINIPEQTITNTAILYGYENLAEFENGILCN